MQTGFLVTSGAILWSSAPTPVHPNNAVVSLQHAVGSGLVGLERCQNVDSFSDDGILPDMNVAYQVSELVLYDSLMPATYYSSWNRISGTDDPVPEVGLFCPAITSAAIARIYGVSYVLTGGGAAGLPGAVFVKHIGDESLFRIPDSGRATVVSAGRNGASPTTPERTLPFRSTGPASY